MNNAPLDHDDIDSVKARRNFKVIVGNKQTVNKKGTKNIRRNKTASENRNYRHYTQGGEGSFTSFLYIIWSRIKSFIYSLKVKLKQ